MKHLYKVDVFQQFVFYKEYNKIVHKLLKLKFNYAKDIHFCSKSFYTYCTEKDYCKFYELLKIYNTNLFDGNEYLPRYDGYKIFDTAYNMFVIDDYSKLDIKALMENMKPEEFDDFIKNEYNKIA